MGIPSSSRKVDRPQRRNFGREKVVTRARILLADDHKEIRNIVVNLLEHEFEILSTVENGHDLLKAASSLKPDLCLLDIAMIAVINE